MDGAHVNGRFEFLPSEPFGIGRLLVIRASGGAVVGAGLVIIFRRDEVDEPFFDGVPDFDLEAVHEPEPFVIVAIDEDFGEDFVDQSGQGFLGSGKDGVRDLFLVKVCFDDRVELR